jgi:hypothetical protein
MTYKILAINAIRGLGTNFEEAAADLSELVNAAISQGWKPQGGVCIGSTQSTHTPFIFQAVVRD